MDLLCFVGMYGGDGAVISVPVLVSPLSSMPHLYRRTKLTDRQCSRHL